MSFFDHVFGNRHDVPVLEPPGFSQGGARVDVPERVPSGQTLDDIEGVALAILYRDQFGEASRRVVLCRELNPDHPGYIHGWCQLRQAERTFRIDRIESLIHLGTGEVIDHREMIAFFAPYLRLARYEAHREPQEVTAAERMRVVQRIAGPGVKVLLFLAMADGHLHQGERAVIVRYVETVTKPVLGDTSIEQRQIGLWIDSLRPTRQVARYAVVSLSQDLTRFPDLARAMLEIVRADGEIHDKEDGIVRSFIAAVRKAHGLM